MKIAVVRRTQSFENFAGDALAAAGVAVGYHHDVASVLGSLRTSACEALVIEDDDAYIDGWFSSLRFNTLSQMPLIVVGSGDSTGLSRALQHGAHDYAVISEGAQTFVHRLLARVRARHELGQLRSLQAGPYALHANTQILLTTTGEVSLTAREFALAWTLFANLGRVVSMHTLSEEIWGRPSDIGKRTIEQHVYKLRRKLGADAEGGTGRPHIQTVYGVGYRLQI